MAEQFGGLSQAHRKFIAKQRIFFVATAARGGRVNLSPKGMDSLRVLGDNELLWLNLTGSGNETAAHIRDINRMTLMWCAFDGPPNILRVYGQAAAVHPRDAEWARCASMLPAPHGARQYFDMKIDLVLTSCGYGVPLFEFNRDRPSLTNWADKKSESEMEAYWQDENATSIDGFPTGVTESRS